MKEYRVRITETLTTTVNVLADDPNQARELAEQQWKDGVHVLDAGHFTDVNFSTLYPFPRDYER